MCFGVKYLLKCSWSRCAPNLLKWPTAPRPATKAAKHRVAQGLEPSVSTVCVRTVPGHVRTQWTEPQKNAKWGLHGRGSNVLKSRQPLLRLVSPGALSQSSANATKSNSKTLTTRPWISPPFPLRANCVCVKLNTSRRLPSHAHAHAHAHRFHLPNHQCLPPRLLEPSELNACKAAFTNGRRP
jgi:hypothetical protein